MPFDVIAAALSAVLLGLTILGLAVRYVLMPYLSTHLIAPIQAGAQMVEETHKQVTVNHHSSPEPTVLDRIDDVSNQVAENTRETRAMARMFDGHLERAQEAEDRFQGEVDRIWAQLRSQREGKQP